MAFLKVVKTSAYHSRFQVKFRRRREGKTDYYARRRLIQQDKNKYESKKYRFVVRRTNRRIITQIIFPTIQGDRVLCQADSFELRRFGLESGLTNYSAAYSTGLLLARRLLGNIGAGMDTMYKGVEAADGEFFDLYEKKLIKKERRPFKAYLDVGLVRTTTGNRVFGAMKGAVDGGIFIPHNTKRFPGYHVEKAAAATGKRGKPVAEKATKTASYNAKEHREHIYGAHVQGYMDLLKKNNKDKFTKQFRNWDLTLTKNKTATLEALYKKVHAEIRKNAKRVPKASGAAPQRKVISKDNGQRILQNSKGKKWLRQFKLTNEQRKARVTARIQKALAKK
jgi:large subunit ribosomal protein L5e